jgi:hypothetical protein
MNWNINSSSIINSIILFFLSDLQLHSNVIRDITFLHQSWPFVKNSQSALLSLSCDGVVKATTLDGRFLHCFEVGHASNSVAPTPEEFGSAEDDGFSSVMMVGGDVMTSYIPDAGVLERHKDELMKEGQAIWKLKYSSNGSTLYCAGDGGVIRRYRRYPNHHANLGELFRHKGDVQDMDISPYDECKFPSILFIKYLHLDNCLEPQDFDLVLDHVLILIKISCS